MKITDYDLEELFPSNFNNRYEITLKDTDTIADAIYRFLFSDNSVVNLKGNEEVSEEISNFYLERLKKQVSKGAPIDFFLTTFSPKYKINGITDNHFEPDLSDLTSFIHLQMIAKTIREIYPYGFRFIIAFKGDLYKRVGDWSDEELNKTIEILNEFNSIAEQITGIRNSISLTRWENMFGTDFSLFLSLLENKSEQYYEYWNDRKEPYFSQIEKWKKDFHFNEKENDANSEFHGLYDFFLTKESCRIRAFNNLIFREGKALHLLLEHHPNLLIAHTRRTSKFFSIVLNPHFRTNSHTKIACFNNSWDMKTLEELKKEEYKPVYVDEFVFPLFFKKERAK